ncbi:hypothetical protein NL64_06205 [Pseudomonas fluorescens]|uniref:hypothetical protein n=1 Tax=Pseudomonas fluorescens TaxID=294 RepID=UPI00054B5475|nr:hypothetical protein [Pseudomonas fluorescens]KII34853.1 hypothetical protein NL64_06205 [Pseudomonas fluorescens]
MDLYVSDEQMVIANNGVSALFQPGVPRPIRESLIGPALTRGARLYDEAAETGAAKEPVKELVKELVEAPALELVVAAIKELMVEGDAKLFAVTGEPKLTPLRGKAGKGVTEALRDEAWALIQAEPEV